MIVFQSRIAIVGDNPPPGATTWTPTAYEDAVLTVLNNIASRPTGSIVIGALGHQPIWIVPGTPKHTETEAVSEVDSFKDGAMQRVCRTGERGVPPGTPVLRGFRGTGHGSKVLLYFTPNDWRGKVKPGEMQDEVLLHELVHAFRASTGTQQCRPWGVRMNTEEEVIAIAVTNMYASHRGRPLRENHAGHTAMRNPEGWIRHHWLPLRRFSKEPLGEALAAVTSATFNPFGKFDRD